MRDLRPAYDATFTAGNSAAIIHFAAHGSPKCTLITSNYIPHGAPKPSSLCSRPAVPAVSHLYRMHKRVECVVKEIGDGGAELRGRRTMPNAQWWVICLLFLLFLLYLFDP